MNKRVLLVDDDVDQLAVRSMLLASHGLDPCAAYNRSGALQLAQAEEFACAVVDLRLPSESEGLRLIRELRDLHPPLRIIVLTGRRVSPTHEIEGVEAILEKGRPSRELLSVVRRLCGDLGERP